MIQFNYNHMRIAVVKTPTPYSPITKHFTYPHLLTKQPFKHNTQTLISNKNKQYKMVA